MGIFVVLSVGIDILIYCIFKNLLKIDKLINNNIVVIFLYCGIFLSI